jgi:hypothetical protein
MMVDYWGNNYRLVGLAEPTIKRDIKWLAEFFKQGCPVLIQRDCDGDLDVYIAEEPWPGK